jgi:ribosomal protein S18 acetylase RimI-like enzyme
VSSSLKVMRRDSRVRKRRPRLSSDVFSSIQDLRAGQESEVLRFLEARPLRTVFLRGFILDNGLESPLNRGTFYGYRCKNGELGGVALIGHATLFDSECEAAIRLFGYQARQHPNIHLILGEQHAVHIFWNSLVGSSEAMPPRSCTELLFERRMPAPKTERVQTLRRATIDDLPRVMPIQAQMAFAESGVDPMEVDPAGFEGRCSRRIEMDRVWVSVENDTLTFKADILSETPDVTYLEGVYVDPSYRGNGYGLKCLNQIGESLCQSARSLCLFVNANAREAQEFYRRAGFSLSSVYTTIFLDG